MSPRRLARSLAGWAGLVAIVLVAGLVLPGWMLFLVTQGMARGLAVLGVVLLMRAGLVSFGHALFFGAGAYAAALLSRHLQLTDAVVMAVAGLVAGGVLALVVGFLVARYREIFFAMLTLALSMVLFGILIKAREVTGGSDGLAVAVSSVAGLPLAQAGQPLYFLAAACTLAVLWLTLRFFESPLGRALTAIRDNEVRYEYLGGGVHGALERTFVITGALAGLGGALVAMNVGHVDPDLSFWTTSGEFVFVAILGGFGSVLAPVVSAVAYEVVRSYLFALFPFAWQLMLGLILLAVVLLLPGGLGSLATSVMRRWSQPRVSWRLPADE